MYDVPVQLLPMSVLLFALVRHHYSTQYPAFRSSNDYGLFSMYECIVLCHSSQVLMNYDDSFFISSQMKCLANDLIDKYR